jgi:tetratricopeptide (TPR) repeat protein
MKRSTLPMEPSRVDTSCKTRSARPRFGTALAALLLLGSCSPTDSKNGAQSDAAQSMSEYDIATDLWVSRGEPRKALEHALKAVELDEDNAEATHLVGLLYLDFCNRDPKECRLEEAARHVRLALEARDDFREAQNTLGVILIHQQKYTEAVAVLEPLTRDILYATPENAWGNLGWAHLEAGALEKAIEALLRSTAVQPAFCVGHYRLGLAYERKKDFPGAWSAYSRALEVEHPRCRAMQVAYAQRAKTALQLGRQDEARSDLEQCVHLDKTTATGRECGALLVNIK